MWRDPFLAPWFLLLIHCIAVRFRVWGRPFASIPDHGEEARQDTPHDGCGDSRADIETDRYRASVKHAAEE